METINELIEKHGIEHVLQSVQIERARLLMSIDNIKEQIKASDEIELILLRKKYEINK